MINVEIYVREHYHWIIIIAIKRPLLLRFCFPVFTHNSVVVKLLRAEYNRRAQLRPLFWDNTIQLPLAKVYTRLKIVSRQKPRDQTKPKRWYDAFVRKFFRRDEIGAGEWAHEVDPCHIFGLLKKGEGVMTIIEGSPRNW